MSDRINQNNILSSWKEIAAYMNCGVRTCIRWEKEAGLPVHRLEGKPKSFVSAYPHELDAWLEKKLNSNTDKKKKRQRDNWFRCTLFIHAGNHCSFYCVCTGHSV